MWDTPAFLQPPDSICQNEITCKLVSSYSLSENSIQIIVPEESNWAKDPRKTSLTPAATEAQVVCLLLTAQASLPFLHFYDLRVSSPKNSKSKVRIVVLFLSLSVSRITSRSVSWIA